MIITVFGANGKVGQNVVPYALSKHHHVRAFVHSSNPFKKNEALKVIQGDIYDNDTVRRAVNECDAIISALGSWGKPKKDILSSGMENIIPAMEHTGVKRIVSLTGNVAYDPSDNPPLFMRISHSAMSLMAPKIIEDSELHIKLLSDSGLDWTVVRSPVMNEYGSSEYNLQLRPALIRTIHRNAVAKSLVDLVENNGFLRKSPFIVRG